MRVVGVVRVDHAHADLRQGADDHAVGGHADLAGQMAGAGVGFADDDVLSSVVVARLPNASNRPTVMRCVVIHVNPLDNGRCLGPAAKSVERITNSDQNVI